MLAEFILIGFFFIASKLTLWKINVKIIKVKFSFSYKFRQFFLSSIKFVFETQNLWIFSSECTSLYNFWTAWYGQKLVLKYRCEIWQSLWIIVQSKWKDWGITNLFQENKIIICQSHSRFLVISPIVTNTYLSTDFTLNIICIISFYYNTSFYTYCQIQDFFSFFRQQKLRNFNLIKSSIMVCGTFMLRQCWRNSLMRDTHTYDIEN